MDQAAEQALEIGPGMEAGDGQIGGEQRRHRSSDEPAGHRRIAPAGDRPKGAHAACP